MGSEGTSIYLVSGANRGLGLEHVKQVRDSSCSHVPGCALHSDATKPQGSYGTHACRSGDCWRFGDILAHACPSEVTGQACCMAVQLLERGDTVIAGVRNPSNAPLLQPLHDHYGDNLLVVKLDVSDSASITQAAAVVAEKVPSLDVLVNNAGIALEGARISEESEDAMLSVFRTNTLGPLLTTQAFLPHLQRGRQKKVGGNAMAVILHTAWNDSPTECLRMRLQIINISSGLGSIQSLKDGLKADPLPDIHRMGLSYKSSKAALNMGTSLLCLLSLATTMMLRMCTCHWPAMHPSAMWQAVTGVVPGTESVALAADLKADGFKVICMCPGHVGTDMGNRGADRYGVPRPALTAETSVKGQLAIIDGLTSEQTGSYFSYTGDIIPY